MDEREKIIREHYPVERLPEDLRPGGTGRVRVTIEAEISPRIDKLKSWSEVRRLIDKARQSPHFRPVTTEEAVLRIRELRDEWDR